MYAYGDYQQLGTYKTSADAKWAIQSEIGKKMKSKKVSNEQYELDGRHIAITTDEAKRCGYENLKETKQFSQKILSLNETLNLYERSIGKASQEIKVVIDIDKSVHAGERQSRHGEDDLISDDEIGVATKKALPALAKLLMFDKIEIGDDVVIQTHDGLNVVGNIQLNGVELLLRVITVMKKPGFKPKPGTIPIRVA